VFVLFCFFLSPTKGEEEDLVSKAELISTFSQQREKKGKKERGEKFWTRRRKGAKREELTTKNKKSPTNLPENLPRDPYLHYYFPEEDLSKPSGIPGPLQTYPA
jgi:hypothetical protein